MHPSDSCIPLACSQRCLSSGLYFIMILRDHKWRELWKLFFIFRSLRGLTWQDFSSHPCGHFWTLSTDIPCAAEVVDTVRHDWNLKLLSGYPIKLVFCMNVPAANLGSVFPSTAGLVQWHGQRTVQMAHSGVNFGQWEGKVNCYSFPLCGYLHIGKGTHSLS